MSLYSPNKISLSRGLWATVDSEDVPRLATKSWHALKARTTKDGVVWYGKHNYRVGGTTKSIYFASLYNECPKWGRRRSRKWRWARLPKK